jgi:ABC-type glycerol-3-phosphate transport system substrate-binding protein
MKPITFFLMLLVGLLATGCSSQSATQPASPTAVSPTILPAQAETQPTATTMQLVEEPTPTVEIAVVDDKFRATDPTTVNLVSGKPKLVEFFAVW